MAHRALSLPRLWVWLFWESTLVQGLRRLWQECGTSLSLLWAQPELVRFSGRYTKYLFYPDIWIFPPGNQAVKCWVWVTIWLNAAFMAKSWSADFEIQCCNISTECHNKELHIYSDCVHLTFTKQHCPNLYSWSVFLLGGKGCSRGALRGAPGHTWQGKVGTALPVPVSEQTPASAKV